MNDENTGMDVGDFGMSPTIAKLAASLTKAQSEMQHAVKDNINPHFRSSYADLAGVMDACRKPLADNGLSYVQMPTCDGQFVEVRTMLMHISGEYIWSKLSVPLSKRDAQGVGSALTYARRYSLSAVVGIAQDDDDGNAAVGTPAQPQNRQGNTNTKKVAAKKTAKKAAKKENGSSTSILLAYAKAIDSCADVDEVDATEASWTEKIEKLPRGADLCWAYTRVKRAALADEESSEADQEMANKIVALQAQ